MIGIVTVNWNGFAVTSSLVMLIIEHCPAPFQLVVVNNSPEEKESFDKSALYHHPGIRVIHASKNTGYSGGLNTGIRLLLLSPEISYILLMNNDVEIEADFFRQMQAGGAQHDCIYAPLILLRDTELVQNTGGKLVTWLGGTINLNKNVPLAQIHRQQPDFLSGCVLFMHREVVETVGLFDETFGSYYEDVDYCLRAVTYGIRMEILWDLRVRHFHSHSTKGDSSYKVYLLNRNQILFARKSLSWTKRVIFIAAAILRGLLMNLSTKRIKAYFQGVKDGLSIPLSPG